MRNANIALPEKFISNMKELLGAEEYEAFAASYENAPFRGLNYNLLKNAERPDYPQVPWCKSGYYYPENERPAKTVAYHAGLFYIQEPSAMSPAEVLGVKPGHRVLDICAAPGGKSAQIAGHLQGKGLLISNDASPSRSHALVKNLERAGVTNAIILTEKPKKLAERFPAFFDRILVDAPCSGEGMFRRDPSSVKAYNANKPKKCMAVQREILYYSAKMLKPGGRMVYSTCTFNKTENEDIIKFFLEKNEDFSLIKIDHAALGVKPGFDSQGKTARIFPHLAQGEGHFIALLQKAGDDEISSDIPGGNRVHHAGRIYLQPFPLDLKGLRVARSGWDLGGEHSDLSHAEAMGIRKADARAFVELTETDAFKYLRGESFPIDTETAVSDVLVCHKGFPLGWARLKNGRLENKLPKGWVIKS